MIEDAVAFNVTNLGNNKSLLKLQIRQFKGQKTTGEFLLCKFSIIVTSLSVN